MLCTPERNAFGTSLRTTPPNEWSPFEVRRVVPRTFLSIVFADFGKSLVIVVRHDFSVVRTGPRTKLFNRLPVRATVLLVEESKLRSRFGIDFVKDRKSTRLNSSHVAISYAVVCLKKKR